MVDGVPGKDLLDFAPGATGAVIAFVVVGALSFVIIQVFTAATVGEVPDTREARRESTPAGVAQEASMRAVRASELAVANGEDDAPIYIAVADPHSSKVTVFDMTSARDFYGPGGPYHVFAGRNATCGLAKSSVDPKNVEGDVSSLSASEKDTQAQWYAKYDEKYPKVGYLVRDGDTGANAIESVATAVDKKNA